MESQFAAHPHIKHAIKTSRYACAAVSERAWTIGGLRVQDEAGDKADFISHLTANTGPMAWP